MLNEELPQTDLSEEAELLSEARRLFHRAVALATRTSSIKVWVPLVCSCVLTVYYIYTLHRKPAALANLPQAVVDTSNKVVPEDTPSAPAGKYVVKSQTAASDDDDYTQMAKDAEQAHTSQQFAEEARLWQQIMDGAPSPQQACPAIGQAYERAGDVEKAITAYEKCSSLEPANLDISIALAHALQAKSDFARAAELYRQCLAKDPRNMDARNGLALIALKQNRLSEANDSANTVLRNSPDNTDALLIAGIVAWRQGRLQDAERIFLRGVALDDQRADFHAFLGRIAEAERRNDQAVRQYDKVLMLDPNDSEIAQRRDRLQAGR